MAGSAVLGRGARMAAYIQSIGLTMVVPSLPSWSAANRAVKSPARVGWTARIALMGWQYGAAHSAVLPPMDVPMTPMRSPSTSSRVRR